MPDDEARQLADKSIKETPESLLSDLYAAAYHPNLAGDSKGVADVFARFAALQVRLARGADSLQRWLIALTVGLFLLTIALLCLTWIMLHQMKLSEESSGLQPPHVQLNVK